MAWRAWAVRAQLHAVIAAAALPADTTVYDGPRPRGDTPKRFVAVGVAGDVLDDFSAADDGVDATQEWSPEGPGTWRTEAGTVAATVVAWSGDTDPVPLRADVQMIVDVCE